MIKGWPFILFYFLIPTALLAQGTNVGKIAQINDGRKNDINSTKDALHYQPGSSNYAIKLANLFERDILQVKKESIHLDLHFYSRDQSGSLPDGNSVPITRITTGTSEFGNADIIPNYKVSGQGAYEITTTGDTELGFLEVFIRRGRMVVEHNLQKLDQAIAGVVDVQAGGTHVQVQGTTVLFEVAEGDSLGLVFLLEGTIQFVGFGPPQTGTNRVWQISRGNPPVELTLPASEIEDWRRAVEHNSQLVWQTRPLPLWKKPAFYIPVSAIGVAAAIIALNNSNSSTPSGTITVNLPN